MKAIPKSEWEWFGNAGHFIVAAYCRFHLTTKVGAYLVSTVGEYFPSESVRETIADSRGVKLEGRGDAREADYMRKIGFEALGAGAETYETMVFHCGNACSEPSCGCGMPIPEDWAELTRERYSTAGEATKGHMRICGEYAARGA